MMARGRKEAVRADLAADLRRRWRFRRRTCQRRHLPRAFNTACGPLGPAGRSLTENTPFGRFSTSLRRSDQLAAVAEF
jgi:hypothetical protein